MRATPPTTSREGLRGRLSHRIALAVAGFTEADLSIETKENWLVIRGEKNAEENKAERVNSCSRASQPASSSVVSPAWQSCDGYRARLEHGLLHVDLVREIPEAKKPRQVPIHAPRDAAPQLAA